MFFGDGDPKTRHLNGKSYPHPALVFMIRGRELFIRALRENRRPKSDTRLMNAPYWNTDSRGQVCLGSMRVPDENSAGSLPSWENAYFASEFTHPSGAIRLTSHPGGFLGSLVKSCGTKAVSCEVSGGKQANASGVCRETR